MIVFIPTSPEVPKVHSPQLWQGLVLILILSIAYLFTEPIVRQDAAYVNGVKALKPADSDQVDYLSMRPLLDIAPSRGKWTLKTILLGNLVHGSKVHLFLNLIGTFAGARICSTFLSFFWISLIFMVGGSLGLGASLFLAPDVSPFVPHVGASAGIFALMGTYYVYNFKFRTRYFYWFPDRRGQVALPTSWFFFFDVILLELVLSAAQLSPMRMDAVDHIAHVVGFGAGLLCAILLRFSQQWPPFIQTRAGLVFWRSLSRKMHTDPVTARFQRWVQCLEINPYNDLLKERLIALTKRHTSQMTDAQIQTVFSHLSPVYCRRQTVPVSALVKHLITQARTIPTEWLTQTPYDVIIRVAQKMANRTSDPALLSAFLSAYKKALPSETQFHHKLELVIRKVESFKPRASAADSDPAGTGRNATEDSNPPPHTLTKNPKRAKKGS